MLDDIYRDTTSRMDAAVAHYGKELAGVRTGRANTALLEGITVDYYGTETPLTQVASLTIPDPLTIGIQPWEHKLLGPIEKAILASDLGLTPNNDGKLIRINMPALTEERRHELVRHVKKLAEEAKVALRNLRRDGIEKAKKLEKAKEISEDDGRKGADRIQKILDDHIARVDKLTADKEKEILDR